jgi:hypothetical protein
MCRETSGFTGSNTTITQIAVVVPQQIGRQKKINAQGNRSGSVIGAVAGRFRYSSLWAQKKIP